MLYCVFPGPGGLIGSGPGDLGGQVLGLDEAVSKQRRPFHDVAKLADVARPVVPPHALHCLLADGGRMQAHRGGDLRDQVLDKEVEILQPLPERRKLDREDADPVEEVLAEPA